MCNNTSLSHFLEGVNFIDEDMTDFQLEEDFLGEDGNLLLLDMEEMACDLDGDLMQMQEEEVTSLPPLADTRSALEDALLSPPVETTTTAPTAAPLVHHPLEKLAHCMRRSEVSLPQKLRPVSHSPMLMKANPFFTGSRVTITPELQHSRQQLWSFVRQQQQFMSKHSVPFTAAA